MIIKPIPSKVFSLFISYFFITAGLSEANEPIEFFTLEQTIEKAIEANIGLKIADEEKRAAIAEKNQAVKIYPRWE
jgi:hypothetical protein